MPSTTPSSSAVSPARPDEAPWLRSVGLPYLLTFLLLALAFLPSVRANPRLFWSFTGVGGVLLAWLSALWTAARARSRALRIELVRPVKAHYIQSGVQTCVYIYWGWYWREVYAEIPLFVAQLLFLYVFEALLTWSRGRSWRIGFGPIPIILSTNVFIWFKDDWFFLQFLLVATAVLGKELIKWQRNGQRVHVFNPSAFALAVFSVGLLATGSTDLTEGVEIASTLYWPPHIYLEIFALTLIVQYFFSTTLVTLSAAAVLVLLNLIYTRITGVYFFVDVNIPIAVFLGIHLLVTDPKTSPRTDVGKVVFGGLYGLAIWVMYGVLSDFGLPQFYDKLLPIPILNLAVRAIDHAAVEGFLAKIDLWKLVFHQRAHNLVYMGGWIGLFAVMLTSGFVEAPHEGGSVAFWMEAFEKGKPHAGEKLLTKLELRADAGSGAACNILGTFYMDGRLVRKDRVTAGEYFAKACALGHLGGCENVVKQFLYLNEVRSEEDVQLALDHLEQAIGKGATAQTCMLLGAAYESGRGRPQDTNRALELYAKGCQLGDLAATKELVRLATTSAKTSSVLADAARVLERGCAAGDAESCLDLASMLDNGLGVERDPVRARQLLEQACQLGSAKACEVLESQGH